MSNFTITGRISYIGPDERKSESFTVRKFWLDLDSRYPQTIEFQLSQDRTALLDAYREGQEIVVHFDLRGRKWTPQEGPERVFNTLEAWKLEHAHPEQAPAPAPASIFNAPAEPVTATANIGAEGEPDDLPF